MRERGRVGKVGGGMSKRRRRAEVALFPGSSPCNCTWLKGCPYNIGCGCGGLGLKGERKRKRDGH